MRLHLVTLTTLVCWVTWSWRHASRRTRRRILIIRIARNARPGIQQQSGLSGDRAYVYAHGPNPGGEGVIKLLQIFIDGIGWAGRNGHRRTHSRTWVPSTSKGQEKYMFVECESMGAS
ncbi:hypothetical protein C8Q80DRAFT_787199 [Daedaleopsis nitida]|nr:hypothetical protein C8Q80DRAFT_787199 [Daedaleopsis nitida]